MAASGAGQVIEEFFPKSVFTRSYPSLSEAEKGLSSASERLCSLLAGVSAEELGRPIATGKWSLGEIADHLILANDAFCRALHRSVKRGKPAFVMPKGRLSDAGRPIAPAQAEPRTGRARHELEIDIHRTTGALLAATEGARADGTLDRPSLVHAFFGELTALEVLQLAAWHMRWHLRKFD